MSDNKNDMFDDDVELTLDDEEVDFDESDFEDDVDDDELDDSDIDLDDSDDDLDDDIDDLDEDLLEEDLSMFDIDVDVDDEDAEEDESSDADNEANESAENGETSTTDSVDTEEKTDSEASDENTKNASDDNAVEVLAGTEENAEGTTAPEDSTVNDGNKKKKKRLGLKICLWFFGSLLVIGAFLFLTTPGRKLVYSFAAKYLHGSMDFVEGKKNDVGAFVLKVPTPTPIVTQSPDATPVPTNTEIEATPTPEVDEVYAKNYLLFGIEEIGGAANTDSIMILTINQRDKSLKFTSLLRDTYVDIPGSYPNKINAAYAFGMKTGDTVSEKKYYGGMKLIEVIENTYDIKIEGFACVNFSALENIIDRLGGVDIELGSKEASYLRTTNYISNPAYRTVQAGWNHLNGNQALGYCRVRKVATLGGANNDYGRTVRQRRVIHAIIDAYVNKSMSELLPILSDCLQYITTNMTAEQITEIFTDVVENQIFNFEENRIPYDGMFRDSSKAGIFNGKYNVTYALVIDDYRDQIILKLHAFLYNDPTAVQEEEVDVEATDSELDSTGAPVNGSSLEAAPAN